VLARASGRREGGARSARAIQRYSRRSAFAAAAADPDPHGAAWARRAHARAPRRQCRSTLVRPRRDERSRASRFRRRALAVGRTVSVRKPRRDAAVAAHHGGTARQRTRGSRSSPTPARTRLVSPDHGRRPPHGRGGVGGHPPAGRIAPDLRRRDALQRRQGRRGRGPTRQLPGGPGLPTFLPLVDSRARRLASWPRPRVRPGAVGWSADAAVDRACGVRSPRGRGRTPAACGPRRRAARYRAVAVWVS
jgi:hypothetical protein